MKKIILLMTIFITTLAFSQTQSRDVVYLKNGSIIKGQITEMIPSKSLKIKTADGSLFVYKMSDVLKIEKETYTNTQMNNNTQNQVNNKILSDYFRKFFAQKRKAIKFIDVTKKNGVKKEVFGQKIYEIEYELLLETLQDIYVSDFESINVSRFSENFDYVLKQPQGWNAYMNSDTKKINKGQRIIANGKITLEETDNGWRVADFINNNYKLVSGNYLTKNMQIQQKERLKKLESAGDYKQPDIPNLTLTPLYLKSTNVPVFENASIKISVKKLKSTCNDCRNDNIMAIEKSLKKAFISSNRYKKINKEDFENDSNTSKFTIYVNDIKCHHRGFSKSGTNKGFSCSIGYGIALRTKFTSPQELTYKNLQMYTATSNVWKIYSTKKSAFNGALNELENQIKKFIFKYEPLSLNVKSIELDKKGNPEYIILENSDNLFNKKKIEFYIIKKSSLTIKNDIVNIGENLGSVTYKKSDFPNEIKMKIKKNKMKKALKKYIGKESELIGISK